MENNCLYCLIVSQTSVFFCVFHTVSVSSSSGDRTRHPGHHPKPAASVRAALILPAAPQQALLHHPPQAAHAGARQRLPGTTSSLLARSAPPCDATTFSDLLPNPCRSAFRRCPTWSRPSPTSLTWPARWDQVPRAVVGEKVFRHLVHL